MTFPPYCEFCVAAKSLMHNWSVCLFFLGLYFPLPDMFRFLCILILIFVNILVRNHASILSLREIMQIHWIGSFCAVILFHFSRKVNITSFWYVYVEVIPRESFVSLFVLCFVVFVVFLGGWILFPTTLQNILRQKNEPNRKPADLKLFLIHFNNFSELDTASNTFC